MVFGLAIAACSPAASVAPSATAVRGADRGAHRRRDAAPTPSPSAATASASPRPIRPSGSRSRRRTPYTARPGARGDLPPPVRLEHGRIRQPDRESGGERSRGWQARRLRLRHRVPDRHDERCRLPDDDHRHGAGMGVTFATEKISGVDVSIGRERRRRTWPCSRMATTSSWHPPRPPRNSRDRQGPGRREQVPHERRRAARHHDGDAGGVMRFDIYRAPIVVAALVAACSGAVAARHARRREHRLDRQDLDVDRDNREGPGLPGRRPRGRPAELHDRVQIGRHLQREGGLQPVVGHLHETVRAG